MSFDSKAAVAALQRYEGKSYAVMHAGSVLSTDGVTAAPEDSWEGRARTMGYLSELEYSLSTEPAFLSLLKELDEHSDELDQMTKRQVKVLLRETERMEVVVSGCEGKHIGASLLEELGRRGVYGKRVVVLNDTVAALLGGSAMLDKSKYSDFIGMICGTGANTCASVSLRQIGKLHNDADGSMLINLESGSYNGMPCGDVDDAVDAESHQPGEKRMEKMSSGAYIGEVCRQAMKQAVAEGLISEAVYQNICLINPLNGAVVDNWACGNDPYHVFENAEQLSFARELCLAIFERSARCMATNILAILRLNGTGRTPEKPACICAEGSLVARSRYFLLFFQKSLNDLNDGPDPRYVDVVLGNDTTLPGSAVAALLNT